MSVHCTYLPDRHHPDYDTHRRGMKQFLLPPPEINLYMQLPDGRLLWQADGSHSAQTLIQQALVEALSAHALKVRPADLQALACSEMREVKALFRNVNRCVQLHTFGPQVFAAKQQSFDYGLGSIQELLQKTGSDALLLVLGRQILSKQSPKAWVSIAVVEPGGRIVWYGMQGGRKGVSLQTAEQASDLVRLTLKHFLEDSS